MQRGEIALASEEQGASLWYPAEVEIFNEQFEQILVEIVSIFSQIEISNSYSMTGMWRDEC